MADLTGQNIQDTYQKVVQVDSDQLQDGTGSNLPISFDGNNVIVSGSITAHEYIVSSSVTNITIATLSGSTEFGNSIDDVHTLIGDVRLKGNETVIQAQSVNLVHSTSSYGGSTGGMLDFTTGNYAPLQGGPNYSVRIRNGFNIESGATRGYGMDVKGNLYLDDFTGTSGEPEGRLFAQGTISGSNGVITSFVSASSNITSTGNISASGDIYGTSFYGGGGRLYANYNLSNAHFLRTTTVNNPILSAAGGFNVEGHVTASGNISASGIITATNGFGTIDGGTW